MKAFQKFKNAMRTTEHTSKNDDNKTAQETADIVDAVTTNDVKQLCNPCLFDDTEEPAVGFCVVCVEYLCQGCCRDHKKSKVTRDHKIIKDNLPEDASVFRLVKEMTTCKEHPDVQVSHKCQDHRLYVCVMCIAGGHRKCDHVIELQKERNVSKNGFLKTIEELDMIKKKSNDIVEKRRVNMNVITEEKNKIHEETASLLQQLQQNLVLLKQDIEIRSVSLTQNQLACMTKDIEVCEKLEKQGEVFEKLIDTAKEHFGCADLDIITGNIQEKLVGINQLLDEQQQKEEVHLKFNPNKSLGKLKTLGHLTVSRQKMPLDNDNTDIEASSDELVEKGYQSQTSIPEQDDVVGGNKKTKGKSTKPEAKKSRQRKKKTRKFMARTPEDAMDCFISGITILQDGRVAVVDQDNRKIKVFSSGDFKLLVAHALEAQPVDICQVGPKTFSIVYKDVKLIDRFSVDGKSLKLERSWKTKYSNVAITKDDELYAVLCKAEGNNEGQIYVQIRRDTDCKVLLEANIFKNEADDFGNDYYSICSKGNEIIVASKYVGIIIYRRTNLESLEVVRTLNANGDGSIDLRGIHVDKDANLYACSPSSRSVYVSAATDYSSMKKIASGIESPTAVAVSQKKDRLIVGCHGDNYIHVFFIKQ